MNKKKLLLFCLIILLFAIPGVLAVDAGDAAIANDNSDVLEITNQDIEGIPNDELLSEGEAKTFTDLNNAINGNSESEIYLDSDYNYSSDADFKNGITIDRDLTVNGNGHTINAKKSARIFDVQSGNVIFINITFLNGYMHKTTYATQGLGGGAISGSCTVINCTFIGNSADYGGAVNGGTGTTAINCTFKNNTATFTNGGALYEANAINCTFEDNFAKKKGGAIYNGSALNCNFTSNRANGTEDNDKDGGGAIYNGSAVNCIFTKNISNYYGGAIYGDSAINCTFIENRATNYGGAISNGNAENCTFTNNSAKNGGAINWGSAKYCNFTDNKAITLSNSDGGAIYRIGVNGYDGYVINCTFTNNRAAYQGGALFGQPGMELTVENCTFINNTAQDGGASYFTGAVNCIFIGNGVTKQNPSAGHGGAVNGAHYNISNCTFINNTSSDYGGAVDGENCENCTFINNTAKYGGALCNQYGQVSAENCTFINNSASVSGGALYKVEFNNCSFENNTVADEINDFYITPTLTVYDFKTKYNSGERLFVTYTDSQGKVSGNGNVTVNIIKNGESLGIYHFLSGDGLLLDLDVGNYTAIFSIPDSTSTTYRLITIEEAPTALNASNINVVYTNNKYLVVTLKDSYGKPIGNANLSITFNGLKNLKTDANGQVKLATKGLKPKTYTVLINYNGDGNYLKSTKSVKVLVKKAKPKITAKKKTFKKSLKVKKYKITLKYKKTPVKKVKVSIKIGKKTFKAKTNNKGKAVFKIKKFKKKGTYKAKITFKGNKYFKKVTKKVKIKIK